VTAGAEQSASATSPSPGEFICLDATPLMSFAKIGELKILEDWFPEAVTPEYVMAQEVLAWKDDHPENKQFEGSSWPRVVRADTTSDTALITQLGQFFASGNKNVGELHVIALTHRNNGTAILDDNSARRRTDSTDPATRSVFMVSMIAAAAISGLLGDKRDRRSLSGKPSLTGHLTEEPEKAPSLAPRSSR
jgi:predicted nucleic acid-binding protein